MIEGKDYIIKDGIIELIGMPKQNVNKEYILTEEQMKERERKYEYLESLGISMYEYTSEKSRFPVHPDGIHHYRKDSGEAIRLVLKENKELPDDLKERLLYYKSIMDKEREELLK